MVKRERITMKKRPNVDIKAIEQGMINKGWGTQDLANATGLNWMTCDRIINGRTRKPASVLKVVEALELTMCEIMTPA